MKIINVIVNELPETCASCICLEDPSYWRCLVLYEGVLPEGQYSRHPDCPLILADKFMDKLVG